MFQYEVVAVAHDPATQWAVFRRVVILRLRLVVACRAGKTFQILKGTIETTKYQPYFNIDVFQLFETGAPFKPRGSTDCTNCAAPPRLVALRLVQTEDGDGAAHARIHQRGDGFERGGRFDARGDILVHAEVVDQLARVGELERLQTVAPRTPTR